MSGELILSVAITAFGNAALNPASTAAGHGRRSLLSFDPEFPSMQVQFGSAQADSCSQSVPKWFAALRRRGARRLWLVQLQPVAEIEPRQAAAFANGTPQGILVQRARKEETELWVATWKFARGQKWVARYSGYQCKLRPVRMGVSTATRQLREAIGRARDFSSATEELKRWSEWFDRALEELDHGDDEERLLPKTGYTRAAKRLLRGAMGAWVFGGMGSWNDVGFQSRSKQARYNDVSDKLYAAVCCGIQAAANSFRFPRIA